MIIAALKLEQEPRLFQELGAHGMSRKDGGSEGYCGCEEEQDYYADAEEE